MTHLQQSHTGPTQAAKWKSHVLLHKYNILVNGQHVEFNLLGWRTALAHARNHTQDLFHPGKIVEILDLWTGEIYNIQRCAQP